MYILNSHHDGFVLRHTVMIELVQTRVQSGSPVHGSRDHALAIRDELIPDR